MRSSVNDKSSCTPLAGKIPRKKVRKHRVVLLFIIVIVVFVSKKPIGARLCHGRRVIVTRFLSARLVRRDNATIQTWRPRGAARSFGRGDVGDRCPVNATDNRSHTTTSEHQTQYDRALIEHHRNPPDRPRVSIVLFRVPITFARGPCADRPRPIIDSVAATATTTTRP